MKISTEKRIMKYLTWIILALVVAVYFLSVYLFQFPGPVALSIHFMRIASTVAALFIYLRIMPEMFQEVPYPRRDYLFASINFFLLSATCFSLWNEAGRIWHVDPSIFTSPIAGLFSLFLIIAAIFAVIAPNTGTKKPKIYAVIVGIICSGILVFVAPWFR